MGTVHLSQSETDEPSPCLKEENSWRIVIVKYDYLVVDLLNELEIPFKRENRKVKKAFRHIGHSHG